MEWTHLQSLSLSAPLPKTHRPWAVFQVPLPTHSCNLTTQVVTTSVSCPNYGNALTVSFIHGRSTPTTLHASWSDRRGVFKRTICSYHHPSWNPSKEMMAVSASQYLKALQHLHFPHTWFICSFIEDTPSTTWPTQVNLDSTQELLSLLCDHSRVEI